MCIAFADPVPQLQNGNDIVSDKQTLATRGQLVGAIVADSAARVVVKIWAKNPGQKITLSLIDDHQRREMPAEQVGRFLPIGGGSPATKLPVTAMATTQGPGICDLSSAREFRPGFQCQRRR